MQRRLFVGGGLASCLLAQTGGQTPADIPFVCPMDPNVRSAQPGTCPRCGMRLVAGIPDPHEFAVRLAIQPRVPSAGKPLRIVITPTDPETGRPAKLQVVHEKLVHLFLVSRDLSWFAHEHPVAQSDGSFVLETSLPKAGEYRILADFYPEGSTPQMIAKTIIVPGDSVRVPLRPDTGEQQGANMRVRLRTEPAQPRAGNKTMLFFKLDPADDLQPYLGAWGHMLLASSDLIDVAHTHPAWEDKGDTIQFNVIFPRPTLHRIWVQFQRAGVLNTVAFNVPVAEI